MEIRIREAVPGDARFLAWVMQEASRAHGERGMWDLAFPSSEGLRLSVLEKLALEEPTSFCHYASFLVAELDGHRVGAMAGYDAAFAGLSTLAEALLHVLHRAGWDDDQFFRLQTRFAPYASCLFSDERSRWVIEWPATIPGYRRRGVMSTLTRAALQRGRDLGFDQCQLALRIGDRRSGRLASACGFEVVDEKRDVMFRSEMGSPGVHRWMMNL